MAETKKTVRALIFESTIKNEVQMTTERKIHGKIIPRELTFIDTVTRITKNYTDVGIRNFTKASNERSKPLVRMLVYEDSFDEDDKDKPLRTTPPNLQDRYTSTPGAPIKFRKEFDKKVLRPKKLVYNEKEIDENYFEDTWKKSEEKHNDNIYKKLTEVTTTHIKIPHIPPDDGFYPGSVQLNIMSASQGNRKKNRNKSLIDETRRTNKSTIPKNHLTNDKENREALQDLDSHNSCSLKNYDRNNTCSVTREDFTNNPSKLGEFTHFRI